MTCRIVTGDALERLREMEQGTIACAVSSPPYWRQRDYGHPEQIGQEKTPEEYVSRIADVFDEVRRVLRADGSAWINLGDRYAASGHGGGGSFMSDRGNGAWAHCAKGWRAAPTGYKPKDLIGLPFMLALEMRSRGWYWRSMNVWAKPNGMRESTKDRPIVSHEYVMQFAKSERYYYGYKDVRLPPLPASITRLAQAVDKQRGSLRANGGDDPRPCKAGFRSSDKEQMQSGAVLGTVWWLAPANFEGQHFAVMPERLACLLVLAGCPFGETVLDPFCGAATTLLAAEQLGRDSIGIELSPVYAEMGERRIQRWRSERALGPGADRAAPLPGQMSLWEGA